MEGAVRRATETQLEFAKGVRREYSRLKERKTPSALKLLPEGDSILAVFEAWVQNGVPVDPCIRNAMYKRTLDYLDSAHLVLGDRVATATDRNT